MTEDEGEPDDDGGERDKGCDRVVAVEDEEADEDEDHERDEEKDRVQLGDGGAHVLQMSIRSELGLREGERARTLRLAVRALRSL